MDLSSRLASVKTYADLLARMAAFHRACSPELAPLLARAPRTLSAGVAEREIRLRLDLADLGVAEPRSLGAAGAPSLESDDARLGAWYVFEGSALGGLVIAGEVRRRLREVGAATRYFDGEGRRTKARWSAFGRLLSDWELVDGPSRARVLAGAIATFTCLTGLLEEMR